MFSSPLEKNRMKYFFSVFIAFFLFLLSGCADKPSDDFINNTIKQYSTTAGPYFINPKIARQFPDNNLKGVYYVDVSYDIVFLGHVTKDTLRFTFTREGDEWACSR